ncbi:helix-turn-helix transcriptional regulator, partial [Oleiphilus sp. HI0061]
MDIENAAKQLEALGNVTRLEIFRTLIQAGQSGMTVGDIQKKLGIPASTLSHHIS